MTSARIRIDGWRPGTKKVSLTDIILRSTDLGLAEAKSATDRILDGETVTLRLDVGADPDATLAALDEAGVSASRARDGD